MSTYLNSVDRTSGLLSSMLQKLLALEKAIAEVKEKTASVSAVQVPVVQASPVVSPAPVPVNAVTKEELIKVVKDIQKQITDIETKVNLDLKKERVLLETTITRNIENALIKIINDKVRDAIASMQIQNTTMSQNQSVMSNIVKTLAQPSPDADLSDITFFTGNNISEETKEKKKRTYARKNAAATPIAST